MIGKISSEEILVSLYTPFKSKLLKIDLPFLIKKMCNYGVFLFNDPEFTEQILGEENIRKEFLNRCFFSTAENMAT